MTNQNAAVTARPGGPGTAAGTLRVPNTEEDELALIRATYARELSDAEFGILVADARHRGLSVVKREVVGLKFQGRMAPYVTLAGARTLAERSGHYAGGQGPFFCGRDGVWVEVWLDDRTPPAAAKFVVHRHDRIFPVVGIATWRERSQPASPTWKAMPSLMLGKAAEMDALRRAGLIGDDVRVWVGDGGDETPPSPKIGAMRRLHGLGGTRGLGHGEVRAVVAAVRPGTASLADPDVAVADLGAAADLVGALDDDAVEAIVADPERLAEAAGYVVAPGEEPVSDERDRKRVVQWLDHIERAKTARQLAALEKGLASAGLGEQGELATALAIRRGELGIGAPTAAVDRAVSRTVVP